MLTTYPTAEITERPEVPAPGPLATPQPSNFATSSAEVSTSSTSNYSQSLEFSDSTPRQLLPSKELPSQFRGDTSLPTASKGPTFEFPLRLLTPHPSSISSESEPSTTPHSPPGDEDANWVRSFEPFSDPVVPPSAREIQPVPTSDQLSRMQQLDQDVMLFDPAYHRPKDTLMGELNNRTPGPSARIGTPPFQVKHDPTTPTALEMNMDSTPTQEPRYKNVEVDATVPSPPPVLCPDCRRLAEVPAGKTQTHPGATSLAKPTGLQVGTRSSIRRVCKESAAVPEPESVVPEGTIMAPEPSGSQNTLNHRSQLKDKRVPQTPSGLVPEVVVPPVGISPSKPIAFDFTGAYPGTPRKRQFPSKYNDFVEMEPSDESGARPAAGVKRSMKGKAPADPSQPKNKRRKIDHPPSESPRTSSLTPLPASEPPETKAFIIEPFLQSGPCQKLPSGIRRCAACITRRGGDMCRFRGLRRFFRGSPRNPKGTPELLVNDPRPLVVPVYPDAWNVIPEPHHISRVLGVVASSLQPVFKEHLEWCQRDKMFIRNPEVEFRISCDHCMTSIFSSGWMCVSCGREFCLECREEINKLTKVNTKERAKQRHKARKSAHPLKEQQRLMYCSKDQEHFTKDLAPTSRFQLAETQRIIEEMEPYVQSSFPPAINSKELDGLPMPVARRDAYDPIDPAGLKSHPFHVFTAEQITEEAFAELWAQGRTLVVTGLLPRFAHEWNPQSLTERYGEQKCNIVDCDNDSITSLTVGEFFGRFGQYEGRVGRLKLKDWPPTSEFSKEFPELYKDFADAVPVPNYTRRDGVLNIAAHFPTNKGANVPDIGPKMYNAFESSELPGGKGSTRLHMDMADAVNIMLYASPRRDGGPGCAVWDIYSADDANEIRQFLHKKFGRSTTDPIHSQHHYLDAALRKELEDTCGVVSWRIYQKPGEAVFIPAGCAHQVCNLADCIKVAVDFVSPENIDRCETLTREFRGENRSQAWKEDVLQLRQTMFHAWSSLIRLRRSKEEEPEDGPSRDPDTNAA